MNPRCLIFNFYIRPQLLVDSNDMVYIPEVQRCIPPKTAHANLLKADTLSGVIIYRWINNVKTKINNTLSQPTKLRLLW